MVGEKLIKMEIMKKVDKLLSRKILVITVVLVELLFQPVQAGILSKSELPRLLLISMDGFRYDYLSRFNEQQTGNFNTFIKNGVKAEYMEASFPTVTYPNHYTIITGLYPESHGIVHNRFYDSKLKRHFWYDDISDNIDPLWYDLGAEPIYVTNQKAGNERRSGSLVWPGGIGKVKCIGPDKVMPNFENAFANYTLKQRINTIVSWFNSSTEPINLGLLYIPEPDEIAHQFGPDSKEVNDYITGDLNEALGYLFSELKKNKLYDSMNIILLADHGFAKVEKFVALNDYIDPSWYTAGSSKDDNFLNHITVNIFPKEGEENRILQGLQKVTDIYIYKKGGVELRDLHYSDNERIAPIVLTGKEGVVILKNMSEAATYPHKGMHGYRPDIKNMRPFFLAMGPAFKKGYTVKPFKNVNVYELMCHILGLRPAPNNGSLDNVRDMLVEPHFELPGFTTTAVTFVVVVGLAVMIAGVFAICGCVNARRGTRLLKTSRGHHSLVLPGDGPNSHHLLESDDDDDEF